MDVNCSATLPNTTGTNDIVGYKIGTKIPDGKGDKDICESTSPIAQGNVEMGMCQADPGFKGEYSVKVYCEEISINSYWALLLYNGDKCEVGVRKGRLDRRVDL